MDSNVNGGRLEPIVIYRRDGSARTAGAISESKGGYAIADTSTTAKVGDIYRAETATTSVMVGREYKVIEASTNSFTIASKDLPVLGDTFYVLGPVTQRVASDGALTATIAGGATEAKQDTQITSLQLLDDAVATTGAAITSKGFAVSGTDGTNARVLKTDASGELQVDVLSSALPSGASTSALQSTLDTSINTLLKPASTLAAVTLVSAVTAITNALPAGTNNIGDVDVLSSALPTGASTSALQSTIDASINTLLKPASTLTAVTTVTTVGAVTAITNALPAGTNNIGDVDVLTLPIAYNAGTVSSTTERVVQASGATGTTANVASSATNVTLLAASTSRLGAAFYNDSTAILYLKFGATASSTSFTVVLQSSTYYELPGPNIYNGIIDGIWASANGNCRVTSW